MISIYFCNLYNILYTFLLLQSFTETLDNIIRIAKRDGTYDLGMIELEGDNVSIETAPTIVFTPPESTSSRSQLSTIASDSNIHVMTTNTASTNHSSTLSLSTTNINISNDQDCVYHNIISKKRGLTWDEAMMIFEKSQIELELLRKEVMNPKKKKTKMEICCGFYMTRKPFRGQHFVHLAVEKLSNIENRFNYSDRTMNILLYRPLTGKCEYKKYAHSDKYVKVSNKIAKEMWNLEYEEALEKNPQILNVEYHVLSGAILQIWNIMNLIFEKMLTRTDESGTFTTMPIRIVRVAVPLSNIKYLENHSNSKLTPTKNQSSKMSVSPKTTSANKSKSLKQSIVVDNMAGGVNMIGLEIPTNKIHQV